MIKSFVIIVILFCESLLVSQNIIPFCENKKWGYQLAGNIIIKPQYDTAFSFDKTNRIALVANKNEASKAINPLTGEENVIYDYSYINYNNTKIKLLSHRFPDSVFVLPNQQELQLSYLDSSSFFKILFNHQIYLYHKSGKQLTLGYDNIVNSQTNCFFETENVIQVFGKTYRLKGLIDTLGVDIIKCKYHQIVINNEDSVMYCCSSVYNTKSNDDVFNYKGQLIYTNKKHIVFSSKQTHIMKEFEPKELYVIENEPLNLPQIITGEELVYLKNNKALVINKNDWFLLDIVTQKKQKVDKELYFYNLITIINL